MATEFLSQEMGQVVNRASRDKIEINLSKEEIALYIKRFQLIDKDNKGYVSINDIRRGLKVLFFLLDFFFIYLLPEAEIECQFGEVASRYYNFRKILFNKRKNW